MNGENPLDASAVHPEAYPVVDKMLADSERCTVGDRQPGGAAQFEPDRVCR